MAVLAMFAFRSEAQAPEKKSANEVFAKVIGIDYGRPNDVTGQNITYGLELGGTHLFNRFFGVTVPLKIGVADVGDDINNRNFFNLDGLLRFQYQPKEDTKVIPYIFGGVGASFEKWEYHNTQIPLGGGLNFRVGKTSLVNVQAEYRSSNVDLRNNIQAGVGFVYRLGKLDRDGDGVADSQDLCPDVPGAISAAGCPDKDGDGITDADDLCPDVPGTLNGCPDRDGDGVADNKDACPDTPGTLMGCPDRDSDGVADKDDQCPDVAGDINGCPDRDGDKVIDKLDECPDEAGPAANNGCPVTDRDGDGIKDDEDDCPDVPGTSRTKGCPDRDNDGVADQYDRCPDVPGVYAGCPDTDGDGIHDGDDKCPNQPGAITNGGCPEIRKEIREVLKFAMQAVQFETGSANLLPQSYSVLDQIVSVMNEYVDYRLGIAGHTDNVGDETKNQVLSEARAKACYDYLVSKGINPVRLGFQGYGESVPIADNNTPDGRRRNRRVEFNLYIP